MSPIEMTPAPATALGSPADLRAEPRFEVAADAGWTTSLTSSTSLLSAEVRNLSVRGAGVQVDVPMPVGTEATIELANESGDVRLQMRMRVVHVTPLDEEGFVMGCRFLTPLTFDQLRLLLR